MSNFCDFDRKTSFLLPPSIDEWLPEKHLARFVVEIIETLNLSAMVEAYRGSGSTLRRENPPHGWLLFVIVNTQNEPAEEI